MSGPIFYARITGLDYGFDSPSGIEHAGYHSPCGLAGLDNIVQDAVYGILIKNPQIAVGKEIHLEGL